MSTEHPQSANSCPKCGADVQDGDLVCIACSANLITGTVLSDSRPRTGPLHLLAPESLVKTGPVDHADWNYRKGPLAFVQRRRFRLILDLIGDRQYPRLLEVGYGSALFMPSLAACCENLLGVDVHLKGGEVAAAVRGPGLDPRLLTGSATHLPLKPNSIDAIVAVSSLEFIEDIDDAAAEFHRVLRPGGHLFAVTPGHSKLLDLGLKVLTGESADKDFEDRRQKIIPTLKSRFRIDQEKRFPPIRPWPVYLYHAFRFQKI